ncbi:glycosyltransferase [Acetobacterium bakii]|uniref:Glycosyl transferase n=1 Tax=Acetobacterium bakii TaxID=52689 RepID=A0A0L6U0L7_9FIRM|nr:glycosyltransferase [Acetobacterium bakii]KNZ42071.1 glycosyl transferase [Acetobacterium bakii]
MRYQHVFFLSPPFYSHFMPLLALAKSFRKHGVRVTFGCSREFEAPIAAAGLEFQEINLSANKNTGTARDTNQPESERKRLEEFFAATKEGPIETLITQTKHRRLDMLGNPESQMEQIKTLNPTGTVDLWVVDILSYGTTLSLHCLQLPYITFCPPHPKTIPRPGEYYGVPQNWPASFVIDPEKLNALKKASLLTQQDFTHIFNQIIDKQHRPPSSVDNAFRLISSHAVIYNYFDFNQEEKATHNPHEIYMGHSFEDEPLNPDFQKKVNNPHQLKILITLGTFLSSRMDVLEQLILGCQAFDPEALCIVSAGSNTDNLKKYSSSKVIVQPFVPQKALIPHMDVIIHHGGCNTFTEAVYYGKPMIILPFSSDQFNIAYDAEKNHLGVTLNPNQLTKEQLLNALGQVLGQASPNLAHWSQFSKNRGPDYAAKIILTF